MTTKTNKTKRGRPSSLTREILLQIKEAILDDSYFEVACRAAGVTPKTGYNWRDRGEKEAERIDKGEVPYEDEALYLEFFLSIDQADAQAEQEDIRYIRYGFSDWQSKAWIRERKSRERWGRVEKVVGDKDNPLVIQTTPGELTDEQLIAIAKTANKLRDNTSDGSAGIVAPAGSTNPSN